ncbi:MAG: Lin0368 family putative glycerol transporter subunit [Bacillota bacterium]
MKKYLGTLVGGAIAGVFVFSIWGLFVESFGTAGGWLGGPLVVGLAWALNHYVGAFHLPDGAVAVDMAVAIGVAGTMNGVFSGQPIGPALPTLLWMAVGAVLGGVFAAVVTNVIAENE